MLNHTGSERSIAEERTKGRVKVEVYPNSQLGGNRETAQATQNGMIQGYLDSSTLTSSFVSQLAVFDLPYLAENTDKVYKILDSPLAEELSQLSTKAGIRPMGLWEATLRSVYSSKIKINSLNDMKGMKIRVIPSPSYVTVFKALGASPVPMSFGELYTALAQGTVDAAENDMVTFYTSKHHEVAKNYAITNHIFLADTLWISEKHFSRMPADIKKIMIDAAKGKQDFVRNNWAERDKKAEEMLKEGERADAEYTNAVVMPGLILDTNAGEVKGTTVTWKFSADQFCLRDYDMWVESRVMNVWAVVLTGVLVLGLVGVLSQGQISRAVNQPLGPLTPSEHRSLLLLSTGGGKLAGATNNQGMTGNAPARDELKYRELERQAAWAVVAVIAMMTLKKTDYRKLQSPAVAITSSPMVKCEVRFSWPNSPSPRSTP